MILGDMAPALLFQLPHISDSSGRHLFTSRNCTASDFVDRGVDQTGTETALGVVFPYHSLQLCDDDHLLDRGARKRGSYNAAVSAASGLKLIRD